MNPIFWLLVLLCAVILWFAISFIFIPLGGLVARMIKSILNIINYEETKTEEAVETDEQKENEQNE